MELSPEDSLRLNVMLANAIAVRIDEGINVVSCLSDTGNEAKIQLNPNCRADQYVRYVRELLSSHVMGSPGGYPVYLKRWTRMGQASDARLDGLLMLGENEAVVAVSGAVGLTDELARRAWWCMSDSDNARRMLQRDCIVQGEMGRVLTEFLLEFLPFEESAKDIIESVRLVLQPGLISEDEKKSIWERGKKKSVFLVGFLHATPDELPERINCRADHDQVCSKLDPLISSGNVFASLLKRLTSSNGQSFLSICEKVLKRPSNQDVIVSFLEANEAYFSSVRLSSFHYRSVEQITEEVDKVMSNDTSGEMPIPDHFKNLIENVPELKNEIRSMIILSHMGVPVIDPIFAVNDAVGSVMRKKIEPVTQPIMSMIKVLRG